MNSNLVKPQPTRSKGSRAWPWLGMLAIILMCGCSRQSVDIDPLRQRIVSHAGGADAWQQEVGLGVGPVLLGLTRVGLALADVEPEARQALACVSSAAVSVNRRVGRSARVDVAKLLEETRSALPSDWERVIAVCEHGELVAVYARATSSDDLELCVCVIGRDEMVLVTGRGNPMPLVEMAQAQVRKQRGPGALEIAHR